MGVNGRQRRRRGRKSSAPKIYAEPKNSTERKATTKFPRRGCRVKKKGRVTREGNVGAGATKRTGRPTCQSRSEAEKKAGGTHDGKTKRTTSRSPVFIGHLPHDGIPQAKRKKVKKAEIRGSQTYSPGGEGGPTTRSEKRSGPRVSKESHVNRG